MFFIIARMGRKNSHRWKNLLHKSQYVQCDFFPITLSFVILNFLHENKEPLFFSLSSDSKKTQWEDPRLQHVAITGPVSLFVSASSDGVVLLLVS